MHCVQACAEAGVDCIQRLPPAWHPRIIFTRSSFSTTAFPCSSSASRTRLQFPGVARLGQCCLQTHIHTRTRTHAHNTRTHGNESGSVHGVSDRQSNISSHNLLRNPSYATEYSPRCHFNANHIMYRAPSNVHTYNYTCVIHV